MTVNELIKQLQDLPFEQRDRDVQIYLKGTISGLLDVDRVTEADPEMDGDWPMIETERLTVGRIS